jgi:hypothetical protein
MRMLLVLAATIGFSGYACAQTAAPKSGKPLKQTSPSAPTSCKLVGTVKGTRLWAGDCTAPDQLKGGLPAAETNAPSLHDQATGAVPADQK